VLEHDQPRTLAKGVVFVSQLKWRAVPKEECLPHPNIRVVPMLSGPSDGTQSLFACSSEGRGRVAAAVTTKTIDLLQGDLCDFAFGEWDGGRLKLLEPGGRGQKWNWIAVGNETDDRQLALLNLSTGHKVDRVTVTRQVLKKNKFSVP
jgi:hypothetical protein